MATSKKGIIFNTSKMVVSSDGIVGITRRENIDLSKHVKVSLDQFIKSKDAIFSIPVIKLRIDTSGTSFNLNEFKRIVKMIALLGFKRPTYAYYREKMSLVLDDYFGQVYLLAPRLEEGGGKYK